MVLLPEAGLISDVVVVGRGSTIAATGVWFRDNNSGGVVMRAVNEDGVESIYGSSI